MWKILQHAEKASEAQGSPHWGETTQLCNLRWETLSALLEILLCCFHWRHLYTHCPGTKVNIQSIFALIINQRVLFKAKILNIWSLQLITCTDFLLLVSTFILLVLDFWVDRTCKWHDHGHFSLFSDDHDRDKTQNSLYNLIKRNSSCMSKLSKLCKISNNWCCNNFLCFF